MLVSREDNGGIRSHVVFVAPDNSGEMREMVGPGIGDDRLVPGIALGGLGISGTPTLLIVDASGTVIKAWVGELSNKSQAQVISELQ
jgi:hypothetical protein